MRRARSSENSSDASAFDAVLMLADASPTVPSTIAAKVALPAHAKSGRQTAASADETASAAR